MATELSVIQTVTNVGQALMTMASSTRGLSATRKKNAILLEEELRRLKYVCRVQGISSLVDMTVYQMEKTNHDIVQKGHTGVLLEMDMRLLELQYQMLCQNLQDYYYGK